MTNPAPELLDVRQVAALTGLNPRTIERCINATEVRGAVRPFPGWKLLGRKKVVPRDAYEAWINELPAA